MRLLCLAMTLMLGLAVPAWADFEAGELAYERGDYTTALKEWRPLAEQNDALAQFSLGSMYAAGLGVPQDYAEAVKWYSKAAEWGVPTAQNNLGVMYERGLGVPQDYAEAVKWYSKAAEQDYAEAQRNLGAMYANGKGVPQDYVQAHMWFNLSAARLPGAKRDRATKRRDTAESQMTPAQIAEAQKLAREWLEKHQKAAE